MGTARSAVRKKRAKEVKDEVYQRYIRGQADRREAYDALSHYFNGDAGKIINQLAVWDRVRTDLLAFSDQRGAQNNSAGGAVE